MSSAAFKSLLATAFGRRHGTRMSNRDDKLTREERLAAKLRENLHRRKAQARALSDSEGRETPELPAPLTGPSSRA